VFCNSQHHQERLKKQPQSPTGAVTLVSLLASKSKNKTKFIEKKATRQLTKCVLLFIAPSREAEATAPKKTQIRQLVKCILSLTTSSRETEATAPKKIQSRLKKGFAELLRS